MSDLLKLLKEGNKPSLIAAIVNTIIAGLKAIAFFFTGNVAMFAEMLHSLGDAANQFFVFIGSALSKKAPTLNFQTDSVVSSISFALVPSLSWQLCLTKR